VIIEIFKRYAKLGCVSRLRATLQQEGFRTKVRTNPAGVRRGGGPFSRGALYALLHNRVYRGQIRHKGAWHPGQHHAIVPETLWDPVQEQLSDNRRARKNGKTAKNPSLLAGLVFDETGHRVNGKAVFPSCGNSDLPTRLRGVVFG
jgi:hypothetical protein